MGLRIELTDRPPSHEEWKRIREGMLPEQSLLCGNWFSAWGEQFLPGSGWLAPVRYLVCKDAEGPVGIYPFAIQKRSFLKFVSLAGSYFPFRGFPVITKYRQEVCLEMVKALERLHLGHAIRFGLVPKHDPTTKHLRKTLKERGWYLHRTVCTPEMVVHLPEDEAAFRRQGAKSILKKSAYYERRMAQEGKFELRLISDLMAEDWEALISELGTIEENSWLKKRAGDMRFAGDQNAAFWRTLLADLDFRKTIKVWLIRMDDEPVSFCFTIDCGQERIVLVNCYVESVAKYSTGSIIYRHMFLDSLNSKIALVSIGVGDSGYKSRWTARPERQLEDWIAVPPSLSGRLAVNILRSLLAVKAILFADKKVA